MAAVLIVAGFRKFFVDGIPATVEFFQQFPMPYPELAAPVVATIELGGGILLLLGLAGRLLGAIYTAEFIYAFSVVKLPLMGWDLARIDLMLIAGGLLLVFAGSGTVSLDHLMRRRSRDAAPA